MAAVFKFANDLVGLSQADLPQGVTMVAKPTVYSVKVFEKYVVQDGCAVVTFLNRSGIKLRLKDGHGSSYFPVEKVAGLLFNVKETKGESLVPVQALAPALKEKGRLVGEALLTAVLAEKAVILRALAAYIAPAHVVPAVKLDADNQAQVQDEETLPTAEAIVGKVDPMYLWELYMCVLGDHVNPVCSFALPDKARRAALTNCCFGKTGVDYDVYKSSRLYERVASLLHFPKIVTRSVSLVAPEAKGLEVGFWDYLDPVVACLENEVPEKVTVKGDIQGVLSVGQLMGGEFEPSVSLYGWRQLSALRSPSLAQVASHWAVAAEADIPL